jgi:hypothetical protein
VRGVVNGAIDVSREDTSRFVSIKLNSGIDTIQLPFASCERSQVFFLFFNGPKSRAERLNSFEEKLRKVLILARSVEAEH